MPRTLTLAGLALALALFAIWAAGWSAPLAGWVTDQQRAVQDALAGAVRALRGGQAGAWLALLTVCFSYGFLHAVGPGHGKAVIGGYGVARRVRMAPLAALALASSLAQAAVAVALVQIGVLVLGLTRERLEAVADDAMLPLSHGLIAVLGLWLLWRGARGLQRHSADTAVVGGEHHHAQHGHDHGHDKGHGHHHAHEHRHDHGAECGCGHVHAPTPEQVARLSGWRDGALLVGAIAMRPCSGSLFLLVLTQALGIGWAGIVGAFAMALGTACVTVVVAGLAVWAREGLFATLPGGGLVRAVPAVELVLGAGIAAMSFLLIFRAI